MNFHLSIFCLIELPANELTYPILNFYHLIEEPVNFYCTNTISFSLLSNLSNLEEDSFSVHKLYFLSSSDKSNFNVDGIL